MISLEEFRESFINEDINATSINTINYPVDVFIDEAFDILKNDYNLLNDISHSYYEFKNGTRAYKNMHIDAAYLDLIGNTLNLLVADFNEGEIKSITNSIIDEKVQLMQNYFENCLKGFFVNAEQANPAVQLARDIRANIDGIYQIHLFFVSTDRMSKAVKSLELGDFNYNSYNFKVMLDVLDIEMIYRSRMVGFEKADLIINCKDFGISSIPCIKAEIDTDQYDSFLAIIPGVFLSNIYKKYNSNLLESNVRSFLKFNGAVNKGIRGTILNEKSRFFTYNNGISTTAKSIETSINDKGEMSITQFTNLQIINGGQTTATLAAATIKNNADLSGIFVQMKLTVLHSDDPDLIRNIAKYANSQNKVKTADLNSSHPFYVRIEDYSRKVFAPISSGQLVQQLWFFERARGQYEQPLMQMTKAQRDNYKMIRPKDKKFTLTDLSKYANCAALLPYYVSWGGEVNAARFHNDMLKIWGKNDSIFNELYYKELIGKKILFSYIEKCVSNQEWYQEKKAYRPQIVAYTFSRLALSVKEKNKDINYLSIWNHQSVPNCMENDIARIAKLVFDTIYDNNRSTANIETYCKKEECWLIVSKKPYNLSENISPALTSFSEKEVEKARAVKDRKFEGGIDDEISIFNKGSKYWQQMIDRGVDQRVLVDGEVIILKNAIGYCNGLYAQLTKYQLKEIQRIIHKLKDNMIE